MCKVALVAFFIFTVFQTDFASVYSSSTPAPLNNVCLGCICEASSDCNRTIQCEADVCGIFKITKPYWIDAGRHVIDGDDPKSDVAYFKCALNEVCAGTTVSSYVTRFAQDCNEDGKIDCYDYAAIHQRGGYGGCRAQPLVGDYLRRFNDCITHINQLGAATPS